MSDVRIDVQLMDRPVQYVPIESLSSSAGGECAFLGRTRLENHPQHGRLTGLCYEAYGSMAQTMLRDLAEQAIKKYDCVFVRIHHAVCEVPLGQASVLVQTACGHRGAAFDACRFLIDELKIRAPIWKREQWDKGTTWSEGTKASGVRQ